MFKLLKEYPRATSLSSARDDPWHQVSLVKLGIQKPSKQMLLQLSDDNPMAGDFSQLGEEGYLPPPDTFSSSTASRNKPDRSVLTAVSGHESDTGLRQPTHFSPSAAQRDPAPCS